MAKFRSCVCPRKKKSRSSRKKKKCYKSGVVTRNPFLNFLRKFRRESCGKSILQIAREGAKRWKTMSDDERCTFKQQAWKVPKCRPKMMRRRRRCKSRGRSSSRRRGRSCTCKRGGKSRSRTKSRSRSRRRC